MAVSYCKWRKGGDSDPLQQTCTLVYARPFAKDTGNKKLDYQLRDKTVQDSANEYCMHIIDDLLSPGVWSK